MSRCRACAAPLIFARTEKGGRIPLDLEPYTGDEPGHLYVLRERDTGTPLAIAVPPRAFENEPIYRSHFRSCSDPDRFSGRNR